MGGVGGRTFNPNGPVAPVPSPEHGTNLLTQIKPRSLTMTTEQTSTALERAMADFAKLDAAYEAKMAREAADPIIQKLDEHIAIFKLPDPRHGFDGGRDVFAQLASARHWMVKRAEALRVARSQQLAGVDASRWLSKAAWCRQSEKHYRAVERSEEYRRIIMGAAGYPLVREGSDQLMEAAE